MEIDPALLDRLIEALREKKLVYNRTDFCEKMGVTKGYLSMLSKGAKPISDKFIKKLYQTFDEVNPAYFDNAGAKMFIEKGTINGDGNFSTAGGNITINKSDVGLQRQLETAQKQLEAAQKQIEQLAALLTSSTKINEWLQKQLDRYEKRI